jgi:hypothetical protein
LFNGLKTRRPEPLDERDKTNFSISAVPARERFSKMLSRVLSLHWRCIQLQHILRIVPATAQRSAVQAHPKWSGQSVINNYSDRRHKSLEGSRTLSKLLRLSDARKKFRARARPVPTRLHCKLLKICAHPTYRLAHQQRDHCRKIKKARNLANSGPLG